jgi:hypothetical protein
MLFSFLQIPTRFSPVVATKNLEYPEKSRNIRRNMASVAELKKSFFAEIDKVENRVEAAEQAK